ncbi:MAG: Dicer-like protein 1 [Claussenomyces sp. TS43310]|nr:MAG: Dicer-like protein 1 [Claussenomyces sp. TS43310]
MDPILIDLQPSSSADCPTSQLFSNSDLLEGLDMALDSTGRASPGSQPPQAICRQIIINPSLATALPTRSSDAVIAELMLSRQKVSIDKSASNSSKRNDQVNSPNRDPGSGSDQSHSDDEEDHAVSLIQPHKISDHRRIQRAVYNSYMERFMEKRVRKAVISAGGDEENHAIKWLVQQDLTPIIASPRDYQVELFERAKTQNIIAVLDTGSGKTLIAVLLLRYMIDKELENRSRGQPKCISIFLADSTTLVFQQFAVLDCNLDQPMDRFCGSMGCDLWSRSVWEKYFNDNMVIVCTPDVLYHCLHHSFISISQINLLIFDEAHHAKKNHAYARIIKDFYAAEQGESHRPKIFGMTASPVDARVDVKKAAAELEGLLHCQIATATDATLLRYGPSHQQEQVAIYKPLREPYESSLCQKLKSKLPVLSKPLIFAKSATSELGPWCADQMWRLCLTDEEIQRLEATLARKFLAKTSGEVFDVLDDQKVELREAQRVVKEHVFDEPQPTLEHLSSKVMKLMDYLKERFERTTTDKCIIFVKQRYTAKLLAELFSNPNIGTPHLRVSTLTGTTRGEASDLRVSFKQQVITMLKFRKGAINCLFATSVAEEGLDIPDCNLVIRFDLYTTVIQYIQSRGRARQTNSKYVHMIEDGNRAHMAIVKEVRKNEGILREFCKSLPADRLLAGNDYDMDYFLAKERKHRIHTEPETGAKLNYRLSLMVLANFVASLPKSVEYSELQPEYVMLVQNKEFICEVILPPYSPVRGALGHPMSTKQVAKCSAAFEACLLLRQGGHLDANFLSTYTKQLPVMREAHLAVTSKKQKEYHMRTKPSIWSHGRVSGKLFLTVLYLADTSCLDRPSQPLGLLTWSALPSFPQFPLFFSKGRKTLVTYGSPPRALKIDETSLDKINAFTLRIFDDVFSKRYQPNVMRMPYFLVPILSDIANEGPPDPADWIAWDVVAEVHRMSNLAWDENTPMAFFANRYVVDPYDGSRKFWSLRIADEYKPLDPVPANVPRRKDKRRNTDNIMEYSCSLWRKSRAHHTFRVDQPVIEAELIPLGREYLDEGRRSMMQTPKQCFIIPEPLMISVLPTTIVAMVYTFPAIIHRLESYLITLEACKMLHLHIRPDLALEALTKDSHNTEDARDEQIEFQRGMGNNYERLEFLGDCFLKMATSISLYTQNPDSNEYDFHVKRMLMICNQNLLNNALNLNLYEYIRSRGFNRRVWYPEGLELIRGKGEGAPNLQSLADKTIADVCEALIGAALLTFHGTDDMDNAVRAVTEVVCSAEHDMITYADYYKLYQKPKYQTSTATASQRDLALQIQLKHAYRFRYPRLLRSAFIHPSYPFSYERIPSYQRLEFLGDSLLDMACVNYLFHRFPACDPQWLTEHKMAMVSNQFLGALCVSLGFHKHLLHFNSKIASSIRDYVSEITEVRLEAEEKAAMEGKDRKDCRPDYWVETTKQPPKCLPDIVEAYIGAVFVDSEYSYAEVERFFEEHIRWYFEDMEIYDTFANKHPITFLGNFLDISMGCSNWAVRAQLLPDFGDGQPPQIIATVMIHNEVVASKEGSSGRYAKIAAAQQAMEVLLGFSPTDFRATYRCDCAHGASGDTKSLLEDVGHSGQGTTLV